VIQIRCHNPQQASADINATFWPWVKAQTMAGSFEPRLQPDFLQTTSNDQS